MIYLVVTSVFFVVAVLVYFACNYLRAKTSAAFAERQKWEAEEFSIKQRTIRELTYDGCAYADELAAKAKKDDTTTLSASGKKGEAIDYVLRRLDWAEESDVADVVESCLAKVSGAGASGANRI